MWSFFINLVLPYRLNNSRITEEGCNNLTSALTSNPSHLRELDLSENGLKDAGLKQISACFKCTDFKLERLL